MGQRHEPHRFRRVFGNDTLLEFPVHFRLVMKNEAAKRTCKAQLRRMAETEAGWDAYVRALEPDEAERQRQRDAGLPGKVSFLIPTYNTDPALLRALTDSLLAQTVPSWEACFYDGGSDRQESIDALKAEAERDPRLRVTFGGENLGISGNTNGALAMAEGDWCALADHDDLLAPDAAFRILEAAADGADMVYSDEDKCSEDGSRYFDPRLKPDFSPDTLRSGNYICHLMAMKTELMRGAGGLRSICDGSQDHDLALRVSERAEKVTHIRRVLYHWRMLKTSWSHNKARACADAAARAVNDQCRRLKLPASAERFLLNVKLTATQPLPDWTLIVSGTGLKARMHAARAVRRAGKRPSAILYAGGKGAAMPVALNAAVKRVQTGAIVFLDESVRVRKNWLEPLWMFTARKEIACAGAVLWRSYTRLRHAGYAVDVPAGAVSCFNGVSCNASPLLGADMVNRNVTAVSRGLMMIRREVFEELGGFGLYGSDLASVALGLKAAEKGYLNVSVWDAGCPGGKDCVLEGEPSGTDVEHFRKTFGEHPEERYMHPLMDRTGTMQPNIG